MTGRYSGSCAAQQKHRRRCSQLLQRKVVKGEIPVSQCQGGCRTFDIDNRTGAPGQCCHSEPASVGKTVEDIHTLDQRADCLPIVTLIEIKPGLMADPDINQIPAAIFQNLDERRRFLAGQHTGVRFQTCRAWPASHRRLAMGRPMLPVPRKAMRGMTVLLLVLMKCSGLWGGHHHAAHGRKKAVRQLSSWQERTCSPSRCAPCTPGWRCPWPRRPSSGSGLS